MITKFKSFVRRVSKDERGQALPMVAVMMVGMLGMVAMVVDMGDVYYSFHQLQNSTDAAALAGAQSLPGSAAATAAAAYSSASGGKNVYANLQNVTITTTIKCLNTLINQGIACVAPGNGNAMQVKQTADVPMYFAQLFGVRKVTVTSTATAAMRGASSSPYNVAIIVDSTASMATQDTDCGNTRLGCALAGVRVLLQDLDPCGASLATCGTITSGNVANSVDRVSLFTFPNVTVGTASSEYDCSSSNPTIPVYSLPSATATTYAPTGSSTSTYQVIPFQSDYRLSDTSASLNVGSNLTLATGGKSGCTGMTDPGGDGTYYAGVIYAAQSALLAEQAANPGSANVIIMLSDGDANASSSKMAGTATNSGNYPSYNNQCGQAVIAAKAAAAAGTKIYSVAYGSASSGCSTDTSGTYKGITPCQTMQYIASAPQYFFSDYNQSGSGSTCQSASQPTTNINQIFTQIAGDFTVARLIPDSTT